MKRRLIVGERIMYANGAMPVNCVFAVTLEGRLQQERIEAAFARLLVKHPLLRAAIREDEPQRPYFEIAATAPKAAVEVLPRQGNEDWMQVAMAQWQQPFDYRQAPLMRVCWLKGETVSDLVIVLPHCICDGGTIVNLMRELLAGIAGQDQPAGSYLSFSFVSELVAQQQLPGKGALLKARLLSGVAGGVLSLLTRNKTVATGRQHYMVRWSVDRELSQQLISACKAAGTSVQAALGTAFLQAFGTVLGAQAKNKLICPVDIRKAVPGIKEDMMFAFAPVVELRGAGKAAGTSVQAALGTAFLQAFGTVLGAQAKNKLICPVDIRKAVPGIKEDMMFAFAPVVELRGAGKAAGAFWEEARRMKQELQQKVGKLKPNQLLVLTEYFHPAADKMLKHLRSTPGSHDVTLSNMGKINIPVAYNGFMLKRVYSPSTALPWKNPNTLVVTSFEGQFDFSFISEETFLPAERAAMIRDVFMTLLQNNVVPVALAHE
ncbi:condensation domain-containing protein [Taibaiella chishuiensis]|nr:condensation domain-containing protein [Taibaiella chishuiensis]